VRLTACNPTMRPVPLNEPSQCAERIETVGGMTAVGPRRASGVGHSWGVGHVVSLNFDR